MSCAAHLARLGTGSTDPRQTEQTQSRGSVKTVNRWLQGASFPRPTLTSPDEGALLAQDDDLGAHGLPRLLDGQVAFFVHVDDGDRGVHASPSHHRRDDRAGDHCHTDTSQLFKMVAKRRLKMFSFSNPATFRAEFNQAAAQIECWVIYQWSPVVIGGPQGSLRANMWLALGSQAVHLQLDSSKNSTTPFFSALDP